MTKDDIFNGIIGKEGDYVNNPDDAGGPTRWGITQRVARSHGYTGDMRSLTRLQAISILDADYWTGPRFDQISQVSMPIAVELVDTGVNMGPAVAAKFLQRCLNVFNNQGNAYPDVIADGQIGPRTVAALTAYCRSRGESGVNVMLEALNGLQCSRYVELAEQRAANESFVYGWIAARVA